MNAFAQVIILSGGAESVSISVADALNSVNRSYIVLSLNPSSLLRNLKGCIRCESIWHDNQTRESTRRRLIHKLKSIRANTQSPSIVFPTEDDGLFLLNSSREELIDICLYSGGKALLSGGLDKNELFNFLKENSLDELTPTTFRLEKITDLPAILDKLDGQAIIKPAHKPWKRTFDSVGSKVFDCADYFTETDGKSKLMQLLSNYWPLSSSWLVQEKLFAFEDGERSSCVVRSNSFQGIQVVEQLKFPQQGGSAVIVKSTCDRSLIAPSERIAEAIDLKGMAEMSFLQDRFGAPKLIELNTRPWLQIELVEASGFRIVNGTVNALLGYQFDAPPTKIESKQWLHMEQLIRGWVSGGFGPRFLAAIKIFRLIEGWPVLAVYSSRLRGVRIRWMKRTFLRILHGIRHLESPL